jgi:homoserine O-acetyltransferase/O-succinyltransferase
MIENPYYSAQTQGPYELQDIGDLRLEEGGTLRGCKLGYVTFGTLNAAKDNAILVPTWYSGTHQIMGQVYIGKDHALNPERYFIVVVNQIGGGISSSPHNTAFPSGMANFPKVRIGDDVQAQHRLLTEKFGIHSLAAVVGGSMGAQQTYEWAVRYPDMVRRAAPIAGTAKNSLHDFLYTETLIEAITSDPGFSGGWYRAHTEVRHGLHRHAKLWAVMGWSPAFFSRERFRALGFSSLEDFTTNFMNAYFGSMDPNDLLCTAWKWQRGDVSRLTGGNLQEALRRIKAKTFVMPIDTDMFFPPSDCEYEQKLIPNSELRMLHTVDGHLGLLGADPEYIGQVDRHLRDLLDTDI